MLSARIPSTGFPQPARRARFIRAAVVVAVVLWSAAVVAGVQWIWSYKGTPGSQSSAPATWPGSSLLNVDSERATLMMFVHPLCVCTRASLAELREALDATGSSSAVWIVLLSPHGIAQFSDKTQFSDRTRTSDETKTWDQTTIAEVAQRIPEAKIVTDVQGVEADRFGASTSGHVVVYDRQGKLAFSGGITGARGHIGDNVGRRGLMFALRGGSAHAHEHPIFGCGLDDPEPIQQ